ncbi:MAG: ATP-binding cassette domain-containing protein [Lachnospiraceae bacterium]|nr:ATP-binding cassette domain-containing protein [Lachnospiraceae bacterium]
MRIENLTFSYGDKLIFDNFSLEIPDEGITALSGPSGCGKTTLMRLIAGLERPDMNRLDGLEMTNDPQSPGIVNKNGSLLPTSKIAMMFQEDRLVPGIAAKKQLEIAVPGCDAEGWLKAVGLENESNTVPEKLSGGMKRRLSLARCLAFAQDKELILLDEPFTGVDPDRIAGISETIRKMRMPIIVTGHTEETLKLADRVILLDNRRE